MGPSVHAGACGNSLCIHPFHSSVRSRFRKPRSLPLFLTVARPARRNTTLRIVNTCWSQSLFAFRKMVVRSANQRYVTARPKVLIAMAALVPGTKRASGDWLGILPPK